MNFFLVACKTWKCKNAAVQWDICVIATSLSQVCQSLCHFHFSCTFLNPFLCPYLPGLPLPFPPPVSLPFVPVWIFHIAAAAGAWCGGLSAHCAYAVWVLRYVAPGVWCVVTGVWPLTPAGRLPVCLSVCLYRYTWPALTSPYPHTHNHVYIVPLDMVPKSQIRGHRLLAAVGCPVVLPVQEVYMGLCRLWCSADFVS